MPHTYRVTARPAGANGAAMPDRVSWKFTLSFASDSRGLRSDDPALGQVRDLLLRVAHGCEDILVVLAELRRRCPDREPGGAVGHGMAEDGEIAERRGV